jgi:CRISPR-associated protein Csx17
MAFLRGELDDSLIARWTEALSLIDWHLAQALGGDSQTREDTGAAYQFEGRSEPPDMAYATLRTLLELECEWQGRDRNQWTKRRSQQPFALMCERSALSLASAVSEALRWISIWGVPNPWGAAARAQKPRISGSYIIRLNHVDVSPTIYDHQLTGRLAAAVSIPIRWQDRHRLYQAVTLPPGVDEYREE